MRITRVGSPAVGDVTSGWGGFDFVIDSVGKASATASGQNVLRAGGTTGIYGLDECGRITLAAGKTFTFYNGGYDEAEAHSAVLNFFKDGKLDPSVWQNPAQTFALASIDAAIEAVRARRLVKPLVVLQK